MKNKKRLRVVGILAIAWVSPLLCLAQTAHGTSGFEVASIKPSDPGSGAMQIGVAPGGVFTAKNVTVKALIGQAFEVRDFQISGGPGWLDSERYDIVAKGNGMSASEDELRAMTSEQRLAFKQQLVLKLQSLLADRFQLKVHRETRELTSYDLVIAKNGQKLQPPKDEGINPGLTVRRGDTGQTEVTGRRTSVDSLTRILSNQVGRTVTDKTGLKGDYDFKMSFTPDVGLQGNGDSTTDGPSIFTALQEQLGLRLDSRRGPVEMLVIDSATKASEN